MPDTTPTTAAARAPRTSLARTRAARRGRALRLAAVGAVAVAGLAACTKPTPSVTVWAGTASVHTEAVCWQTCTADVVTQALAATDAPVIEVLADSTVGISVDPKVADAGWYPAVGTSKLVSAPIKDTYYRFTFPAGQTFPAGGFPLEIVAVGSGDTPSGVWVFRLADATQG